MLRGTSFAKVDAKGRLKLPARFRSYIESQHGAEFFVTSIRGESVRIYPMPSFVKLEEKLEAAPSMDPRVHRFRTAINYYGRSVSLDGQGRVLIHSPVRDLCGINGEEVAVVGHKEYLEVWNQKTLDEQVKARPVTDEDLSGLGEFGL